MKWKLFAVAGLAATMACSSAEAVTVNQSTSARVDATLPAANLPYFAVSVFVGISAADPLSSPGDIFHVSVFDQNNVLLGDATGSINFSGVGGFGPSLSSNLTTPSFYVIFSALSGSYEILQAIEAGGFYDSTSVYDRAPTLSAIAATPLPAALPLFATGLGALGLLGWRRKRKNAAG